MLIILKNPVKDDRGWHAVGERIDVPSEEAQRLCSAGIAAMIQQSVPVASVLKPEPKSEPKSEPKLVPKPVVAKPKPITNKRK